MRRTSINLDSNSGERKRRKKVGGSRNGKKTARYCSLSDLASFQLVGKRQISVKDQGFTANR